MPSRQLRFAPLLAAAALTAALSVGPTAASAAPPVPSAVQMTVTPLRDARAPFVFRATGRIVFRAPTPGGACAGLVSMALKANGQPLQLRQPKVGANCRFAAVFTIPRRAMFKGAKTVVIAGLWLRFGALTSVIAPARTVRVR
jgi:hypothetical protein